MYRRTNFLLTIVTFISVILAGCGKSNNKNDVVDRFIEVHINDYADSIIRYTDIIQYIDTIELQTKEHFMGAVLDYCISDSIIYVIDMANAVWAFKYPSGEFVNRVHRMGHGNDEYLSLRAIISRDSTVYLLDIATSKILFYNNMLNYKESVKLSFSALDFAKIQSGFLFCNATTTDDLHRLVYTDDRGKIINSYLPDKMELDLLSSERTFTKDNNGTLYFNAPYSNNIYKWTTGGPVLQFQTQYREKRLEGNVNKSSEIAESKQAYNATFFVTDKKFVNSFIQNHVRYYSFHTTGTGNSLQGFVDTTECVPFYPTSQYKDALIGIYNVEDLNKWSPKTDSCDVALFVFHLK